MKKSIKIMDLIFVSLVLINLYILLDGVLSHGNYIFASAMGMLIILSILFHAQSDNIAERINNDKTYK